MGTNSNSITDCIYIILNLRKLKVLNICKEEFLNEIKHLYIFEDIFVVTNDDKLLVLISSEFYVSDINTRRKSSLIIMI